MINSMPWWWLLIYALAVLRLTGIVAKDVIMSPVREALVKRFDATRGGHRKLAYMFGGHTDEGDGCPWCLSIWIAAPVAPLVWYYGDQPWMIIPALWLAFSQLTGMLASIGRG